MKMTTALAIVSVCLAGVACSEATPHEDTAPVIESGPVAVEDTYTGTLNLNLPSTLETSDASSPSGTLNLNIGGEPQNDGLLIGSSGFSGDIFGDDTGLELQLPPEDDTVPAASSVPNEDDDIIRLEPK